MFNPTGFFEVKPLAEAWGKQHPTKPEWADNEELKKQFARELAKGVEPFHAALAVFPGNSNAALWASNNWINDPVVSAEKTTVCKDIELSPKILDKHDLAHKVLTWAEEKDPSGKFFVHDLKDRVLAAKLYGEICGYVGKPDTNNLNNIVHNEMKITYVRASEPTNQKTIDAVPVKQQQQDSPKSLPIAIKLVKSA